MAEAASLPLLLPVASSADIAGMREEHVSLVAALRAVRLVYDLLDVWRDIRGTDTGRNLWHRLTPAWREELQRADRGH